jgi:hypothetical protein
MQKVDDVVAIVATIPPQPVATSRKKTKTPFKNSYGQITSFRKNATEP